MNATPEDFVENENDGEKQTLSIGNSKSELEKFSRRLIRTVARMLLHEKRNEAEVWDSLKKQTGFDCKELWERMYALTLKKLDRLLNADDHADCLPKAARMSITDWLLFDTVIVHQDIDVIGMTETSTGDRKVLEDLFDLVEKFGLELLAGSRLADAWSAATIDYNKENRQCTPMMLQRRWYQLKLATRARFYKYWIMYRGIHKNLSLAEPYKPTPLQTRIAKRYKPLVVTQFMSWEDLIKNKLVILPEEFEMKEIEKEGEAQKETDENSPDVVCIEQAVEIIDLENQPGIESEDRSSPQNEDLATISIKQEPKDDEMDIDEDTPYQNRLDKISHFAEAVMEATTMELAEIELAENIAPVSTRDQPEEGVALATENTEIDLDHDKIQHSCSKLVDSTNQAETPTCSTKESDVNDATENQGKSVSIVDDGDVGTVVADENNDVIFTDDLTSDDDIQLVKISNESQLVLPQITSVFGGVNDSTESLSKISQLTAHIPNDVSKGTIEKESASSKNSNDSVLEQNIKSLEDFPIEIDSADDVNDDASNKQLLVPVNDSVAQNFDVKEDISTNFFGELSNDIDFVDDGIQIIDDGIAYKDEDCSYKNDRIETKITSEILEKDNLIKDEDTVDESNKFDKLLMIPVVYTVKLEDMGILPVELLNHVDNKTLINTICSKSKVVTKTVESYTKSESYEDQKIIKKVKLSSCLLQKPRSRTYHPIQLCKNPDFNTRLKRLNVGFFSSSRNRLLYKACQPITIDVSKAFENRLLNGTLYLQCDSKEFHGKMGFPETRGSSVLPSAMPAQSLIDNTEGEIVPIIYRHINTKPVETTSERNKVINLPDISEIRRINQKLLTAQVTPIQFKNDGADLSASLVSSNCNINNTKATANPACNNNSLDKLENNIAINPTISKSVVTPKVDSQTSGNARNWDWKTGFKASWKSKEMRPDLPWTNTNNRLYTPDTLLALDTLNKMLFMFTNDEDLAMFAKSKKKKTKNTPSGDQMKFSNNKKTAQNDDTDEVQVISENEVQATISQKDKSKTVVATKRQKTIYCCWARQRIAQLKYLRKRKPKHMCPFPLCLCCCRMALLEYFEIVREDKDKPSAWLNLLAIEEKCNAENNVISQKKDISTDVAELIPIQTTPESSTTKDNGLEKTYVKETPSNEDAIVSNGKYNTGEIVSNIVKSKVEHAPVCSDNSTKGSIDYYVDDSSTLGAEVSIITSEDSAVSADITDVENPLSSRKPRIRVTSSNVTDSGNPIHKKHVEVPPKRLPQRGRPRIRDNYRNKEQLTSQQNIGLNIETLNNTTFVDSSNINTVKEGTYQGIVKVRNDLIQPAAPKSAGTQTTNSNQKYLYLNSKQISELPSDNPIHLGKNKILLTNLKFPPNFKAFEAYQRNLRQTMALPKGINLVLQPNGRLTYTRDRNALVTREFIAAMPHLIEAIQQQIDSAGAIDVPPLISNIDNEIICLSDDDTSGVTNIDNNKKSDETLTKVDDQNKSNCSSNPETQTHLETTDRIDFNTEKNNTITNENITVVTDSEETTTVIDKNTNEINSSSYESTNKNIDVKCNENMHQENNSNETSNISCEISLQSFETGDKYNHIELNREESTASTLDHNKNPSLETNVDSSKMLNENIDIEIKEDNSKTKNILSDLMAMSGISPTEIVQELPVQATPSETPSTQLPIQKNISALPENQVESTSIMKITLPKNIIQSEVNPSAYIDTQERPETVGSVKNTNLAHLLTPITSLSELKYACLHKGLFFKLDLDTKILLPINVCMKNHNEPMPRTAKLNKTSFKSPKEAMIDLTNDDESEGPKISQKQSLLLTNELVNVADVNLASTSDAGEHSKTNEGDANQNVKTSINCGTEDEQVKPIKLISVPPSILQRHLANIQKRIIDIHKKNNLIGQKRKRIHGKMFLNHKLEQKYATNRKNEISRFTFETSSEDSLDSSSDEEPLAVIATKKRKIEMSAQYEVPNEQSHDKCDSPVTKEKNISDAHISDGTAVGKDGDGELCVEPEEVFMEYLDEELLNEDEQDETCILGV